MKGFRNTFLKRFLLRILKFGAWLSISILSLLVVSMVVFYLFRDRISTAVLLQNNTYTKAELTFANLQFNPFRNFPDLALQIDDIRLYENKLEGKDSIQIPLIRADEFFVTLDVLQLLQRKVVINQVELSDGNLFIHRNADSTLNIQDVFWSKSHNRNQSVEQADSVAEPDQAFGILLREVHLKNFHVQLINDVNKRVADATIQDLSTSLALFQDSILLDLDVEMQVHKLKLTPKAYLKEQKLSLNTQVYYNSLMLTVKMDTGSLHVGNTTLLLNGTMDLLQNKLDLSFRAKDDLGLSKMFLSEKAFSHIKKGTVYLNGTSKGTYANALPETKVQFGIKGLELEVPEIHKRVRNINLSGYVDTGNKTNFSETDLQIDTLEALLPQGSLNARFTLHNLLNPYLKYDLHLDTKLDGLDELFGFRAVQDLKGGVVLKHAFEGRIGKDGRWFETDAPFYLRLDSLSATIPATKMHIASITGEVRGNADTLQVKDLALYTENSDFLINGALYHLPEFIVNTGRKVAADLELVSNVYDQPEFLSFQPQIKRNFPYVFKDVDLKFKMETSVDRLQKSYKIPYLFFDIDRLKVEIEGFLPLVDIQNVDFTLGELDSTLLLDFKNIELQIAGAEVEADFQLHDPKNFPIAMKGNGTFKDVNLAKLFHHTYTDSLDNVLNALLTANINADFMLGENAGEILSYCDLKVDGLNYASRTDTVMADTLRVNLQYLNLVEHENQEPLQNLAARANIMLRNFTNPRVNIKSSNFNVDVDDGLYSIYSIEDMVLGMDGESFIHARPFDHPPTFEFTYVANGIQMEHLLSTFKVDSVLTGEASAYVSVSSRGSTMDEMISSLNGELSLKSDGLLAHGLDVDDFIKKFQRSQNFNLVDLGAIAVAGPVGIAITKGSDYARIMAFKRGDSTIIPQFVSNWDVKNGTCVINDVAFSTRENRIAAKGWVNLVKDSLDFEIAVLEPNGCSVIKQGVKGAVDNPEMSKVKILKAILGPLTNIVKDATSYECQPFYTGAVKHPE